MYINEKKSNRSADVNFFLNIYTNWLNQEERSVPLGVLSSDYICHNTFYLYLKYREKSAWSLDGDHTSLFVGHKEIALPRDSPV